MSGESATVHTLKAALARRKAAGGAPRFRATAGASPGAAGDDAFLDFLMALALVGAVVLFCFMKRPSAVVRDAEFRRLDQ